MAVHYPADVNIFACVCIDDPSCSPKDKTVLRYCLDKLDGNFTASAEDEKTLKVMMQLEQSLGKEIVWVRGKSFDQIIDETGCLPTWARRFCTTDMKILPIFEYCYFRFGIVEERIGFRYDELWRAFELSEIEIQTGQTSMFDVVNGKAVLVKKPIIKTETLMREYPVATKNYGQRKRILEDIHWANKSYPMIDDRVDRIQVNKFWENYLEFDFPDDSNCKGCHHKDKVQIKANHETNAPILNWFAKQEKKGKFNTWHDDQVTYEQIFAMEFSQLLPYAGTGGCNTGYCLMD